MSKYPGNIKLAREHLRLAEECRERAMELDPSLRTTLDPKPAPKRMAFDAAMIQRLVDRAMKKEINMKRPHAFDEGGPKMSDLREAHSNLKEACDSLGEMIDKKKFPFSQARDHCKAAMDHASTLHEMLGGGEGEDELESDVEREKAAQEARDGVGETPAKSVVTVKQRGADSAHGFDAAAFFQRDPSRNDLDATRQRKPRTFRRPKSAQPKAHDADSDQHIESLFQRAP
jgi:hypothetical protein